MMAEQEASSQKAAETAVKRKDMRHKAAMKADLKHVKKKFNTAESSDDSEDLLLPCSYC